MDFSFSEEQTLLKESVSDFVKSDYAFSDRAAVLESEEGFSRKNLKTFADLDWNSIPFSEEDGGFGGTAVELMAVMEEFGKGLVVEPYFSSVILAGSFLRKAANSSQKEIHIPKIIDGSKIYAAAFSELQSRYDLYDVKTSATKEGAEYSLNGEKIFVLGGYAADTLIVSARTSGKPRDLEGVSLFIVAADTAGISKENFSTVDGFKAANLKFENVKVSAGNLLGEEGKGLAILEDVAAEAIIALGAEAVGALEILYRKTVEYSKIRVQFNQPIGKFQSLQMIMSEMFIEHVQVKSMLYMAVMKFDAGEDVQKSISAFKVQLGKAIKFIGQNAIQLHGGIGMTDELDVSHYFKRVTMIGVMFGDESYHLDRYVRLSC
ncbi:MAG: acyl-CoA dehydrogenase family protein [SAR324 cluster bacterium]|nr:acyl-CoA dehydrogenase family protein [SAR324 cluster bacterium]